MEIVTNPAGARVIRERDGEPLGLTPINQPWPRAPGSEPLLLERDGYRRERLIAPLDRDLHVTLDLKKVAAPVVHPAPPSRRLGSDGRIGRKIGRKSRRPERAAARRQATGAAEDMSVGPGARRLILMTALIVGAARARTARAASPPNPSSPSASTSASPSASAGAAEPVADTRARDLAARDLFQSRRYAEALASYQRLYAETHHPTYLRNIGRCHQMMREPDPAIDNFRAYLRDAHGLAAGERQEIDGYIDEMQRLKAAPVAPPPAASGPPTPPAWSPATVATTGTTTPAATESAAPPPITHRWWFWTGIGALAVTGLIVAIAVGGSRDRLPCPAGAMCP